MRAAAARAANRRGSTTQGPADIARQLIYVLSLPSFLDLNGILRI